MMKTLLPILIFSVAACSRNVDLGAVIDADMTETDDTGVEGMDVGDTDAGDMGVRDTGTSFCVSQPTGPNFGPCVGGWCGFDACCWNNGCYSTLPRPDTGVRDSGNDCTSEPTTTSPGPCTGPEGFCGTDYCCWNGSCYPTQVIDSGVDGGVDPDPDASTDVGPDMGTNFCEGPPAQPASGMQCPMGLCFGTDLCCWEGYCHSTFPVIDAGFDPDASDPD